jgi:hypothetical protein
MKSVFLASFVSVSVSMGALAQNSFQSPPRPAPMAIEFAFTSIGEGIDGETFNVLQEVATEMLWGGKLVKVTQSRFGREGERTLCFEANNFTTPRDLQSAVLAKVTPKDTVEYKIKLKCE